MYLLLVCIQNQIIQQKNQSVILMLNWRIIWKTPLYAMHAIAVNPKGTTHSEEHAYVMKRYRLDRHMASAYLIALRARRILRNLQRPSIQEQLPYPLMLTRIT
jgi:hypothetical protein